MTPLTAEEAARLYPRLAWFNEQVFAALGAARPDPDRAARVVALARHLGEHAQLWADVVPESVLLAHLVAPGPPDDEAESLIGAMHSAADPVGVVLDRIVPWLLDTYRALEARLPPHAEGAALRLVALARRDLLV